MLLYLVLYPEGATTERLADILLPDVEIESARNRLWQSATEARRIFGDDFRRDQGGCYQLDRVALRIDIDELNQLLGENTADDDADRLEQALNLFRGEPLPDVDWPWVSGHVGHLRATYVTLLERVGRARLLTGDPPGAVAAAERALQLDQLNEALWRLAMEADCAAGLRESANRRYDQLTGLLRDQLGLEPESSTRCTYYRLLGQE